MFICEENQWVTDRERNFLLECSAMPRSIDQWKDSTVRLGLLSLIVRPVGLEDRFREENRTKRERDLHWCLVSSRCSVLMFVFD